METLRSFFSDLWKDESAEVAIEYGLLVAVIAIGLIVAFTLFRDEVRNWYSDITNTVRTYPS